MCFFLSPHGLSRKLFLHNLQGELFLAANKASGQSGGELHEKPSAVCWEELVSDKIISFWFLHWKREGKPSFEWWESRWQRAVAYGTAVPRKRWSVQGCSSTGCGRREPCITSSPAASTSSTWLSTWAGRGNRCPAAFCAIPSQLCLPVPPGAFQIALAFGLCSQSAKWVLSQIWLVSQF